MGNGRRGWVVKREGRGRGKGRGVIGSRGTEMGQKGLS